MRMIRSDCSRWQKWQSSPPISRGAESWKENYSALRHSLLRYCDGIASWATLSFIFPVSVTGFRRSRLSSFVHLRDDAGFAQTYSFVIVEARLAQNFIVVLAEPRRRGAYSGWT